ncbi:protein DENND6A [Sitophilus oryzae]|uniref:Protein DENND6A n=1 Tax=Sitophilus oryzae TaxID=7048 RepID=A0A6J2XX18_SITOR|nr:protein DENND6A [Sitophilus oryzae]
MTDGPNNIDSKGIINQNVWDGFSKWFHCICVVTFDLELGQALENIYPRDVKLSKQDISNICYLAFPDSNSGCMGDTTFVIRLQSKSEKMLRSEHVTYNSKCPPLLKIDESYLWGYVYFRQVKDLTLPRGYFQKSIVMLSYFPFNNLFSKICSYIAPEYFEHGEETLEVACYNIALWSPPVAGVALSLPILGSVFQTFIPLSATGIGSINSTLALLGNESNESQKVIQVDDLNLFEILQPVLSHVHLLWELVITSEPIVVMASSPTVCSSMVLALTRLIAPLQYCGDYRPYFTIHDSEFKQYTSKVHGPPPVILGVTNPFFAKSFQHWPHTIRLNDETGETQKYKLKKTHQTKMIESNSGIYTSYKPFLQKDKNIIKKLKGGVKRPYEAQSIMLSKHLLELTQSFMFPLERYIASLLPLQKNISAFKAVPTPNPFNPDDFFATLDKTGPHLTLNKTGIKGDWIGLYRKFFRSPNFKTWFNARYTELSLKLQALHAEALSTVDITNWVRGRPEVEIVDMVMRLKSKICKCNCDVPVSDSVKQQLNQRMHDIATSLPEDLKNILQIS